MKILRGAIKASGYRILHLVDPEDSGILRFEETGEMPEGMDFAVLWKAIWRQGRCYPSYPDRTFVTYHDALLSWLPRISVLERSVNAYG
jgi:hypothetical protein